MPFDQDDFDQWEMDRGRDREDEEEYRITDEWATFMADEGDYWYERDAETSK